MGGFAALSNCDLADLVIAFNPQINLCRSSLRPGLDMNTLTAATNNLMTKVNESKSKIIINAGLDEHLVQIYSLNIDKITLLVHPFMPTAGLSRHLNNADKLKGIVLNLIHMNK